MRVSILIFVVAILGLISCQHDTYYSSSSAKLRFSGDTVCFDTVFANVGSQTVRLMVYNPYKQAVKISTIQLAGGSSSPFKININGKSTTSDNNIDIEPLDSLYIFVQFYKGVSGSNLPVQLRDSLVFNLNGNFQYVPLLAYNQDVNLVKNDTLQSQTWDGDKPYLIWGNVLVDTLQTLTIKKGVKVYFRWNSNLIVKGRLQVDGDLEQPVVFCDEQRSKTPGQWGGIQLKAGSRGNVFEYATIKNGTTGINTGGTSDTSFVGVELYNTKIFNMVYSCLLASNTKLLAANCIIANAGTYVCGLSGGNYRFYHCTFDNNYSDASALTKSQSLIYLANNYWDETQTSGYRNVALVVTFGNSIVYGNESDNVELDSIAGATFGYSFNYCLMAGYEKHRTSYSNIVWNKNPKFKDETEYIFEPDSVSPARGAGSPDIGKLYPLDYKKKDRSQSTAPTLGAFE